MKKIILSSCLIATMAAAGLAQQNAPLRPLKNLTTNTDDEPQNTVKKTFKGKFSGVNKIVLNIDGSIASVEGCSGDEVIIEAENPPQMPKEAEGLRPLSAGGTDNTGLGLAANVNGAGLIITTILKPNNAYENGRRATTKYRIKVPTSWGVAYKQGSTWCDCDDKSPISISNIEGEVEIKTNDIGILLTNVTGPIVAKSNNGKIKVVFDEKTSEKPSSFVTYDGNIDITISEKAKIAFGINTSFYGSRSNVFTDLDLKTATKSTDDNRAIAERAANINTQFQAIKAEREALKSEISKARAEELKTEAAAAKAQAEILKADMAVQEKTIKEAQASSVKTGLTWENTAYEPASWAAESGSKTNYVLNDGKTKISIRTNNGNVFLRKK